MQVTWAQALYFVRVVLLPADDSAFLGLHSVHLKPRVLLQQVAANTCTTTKHQGSVLDSIGGGAFAVLYNNKLRCFVGGQLEHQGSLCGQTRRAELHEHLEVQAQACSGRWLIKGHHCKRDKQHLVLY
jgi:hypothetical protein